MFRSVRSFLAFSYALVVLLIVTILGASIQLLVEDRLRDGVDAGLEARGDRIAAFITSDTDIEISEQVRTLLEGLALAGQDEDVTYLRLYSPTGLVLLDAPPLPIEEPSRGELRRVTRSALRTAPAEGGGQLRVLTRRVLYEDQLVAYLQVGRDLSALNRTVSQLRTALVAGGVLAAAIAGAVAYALAYQALKPFSRIVEDSRSIGADDLDRRLPPSYGVREVNRLAQSYNALLDRLRTAFDLQRRFVADASHELRTPLTTIRGNLEVLLLDPDLSAPTRDALRQVSGETARMSRLINNLLLLARADAGQARPPSQLVDLHALVLETVSQARSAKPPVGITLGQEDQAFVAGDADQLKQVLLNLLDNAVKYTPAGGWARVSVYREGAWAKLEVADNGVGIAPEDRERIFDRFYRGERVPTPRGTTGSGLGLSIATWVVRAHGGRIGVESTLGGGSVFTVWLPLAKPRDKVMGDE